MAERTLVNDRKGFTLIELLVVVAVVAIIAAIAIPYLLGAMQRARQKRSMADIRNMATAWEARATDTQSFTAAGLAAEGFIWPANDLTYAQMQSILHPTYFKGLPKVDGWAMAFDFAADQPLGNGIASKVYGIRSRGRDRKVDAAIVPGPTTQFDCDIVYSNGGFVMFPQGVQAD